MKNLVERMERYTNLDGSKFGDCNKLLCFIVAELDKQISYDLWNNIVKELEFNLNIYENNFEIVKKDIEIETLVKK